jgi:hypothetical protein
MPARMRQNGLASKCFKSLLEGHRSSELGAYPGSETQYPSNHSSTHCLKHFEARPISPHVYNPHRAFTETQRQRQRDERQRDRGTETGTKTELKSSHFWSSNEFKDAPESLMDTSEE